MTKAIAAVGGHDFDHWRNIARTLVSAGMPPEQVRWSDADTPAPADLFADAALRPERADSGKVAASREFVTAAKLAILHRDPARHALLYRLLWRLQHTRTLMRDGADPDVRQIDRLVREVRRDIHKMRAFVRFNPVTDPDGGERYVAWFEPTHHIVEANADFFVGRFHTMRWSIVTPQPGALESRRDDEGDAQEILAQPSRSDADTRIDCRRAGAGTPHGDGWRRGLGHAVARNAR